jgi:predicted DNA-binding transcriptional regulator AlpA
VFMDKQQLKDNILTVNDVCEILKISRTTLWKLKKQDKLKPIPMKIKTIRYSKEDVEKFIRMGI